MTLMHVHIYEYTWHVNNVQDGMSINECAIIILFQAKSN